MKNRVIAITLLFAIYQGCTGNREEVKQETVRPVKVITAETGGDISRSFTGTVVSGQYSNLTFKIPGTITSIRVEEGPRVGRGSVIAELDPRDYELQHAANEAAYHTARSSLERNKRLLTRQAISQQDMEMSEANYVKAKSAWENSKNVLSDTRLVAPFSGFVEVKHVENYQKVQPGEPIVKLVDPTILNVKFSIPERSIDLIASATQIDVRFEVDRERTYRARIREYVSASPDGSGIPVTLEFTDPAFNPQTIKVSPGFSCLVTLRTSGSGFSGKIVPVSALFSSTASERNSVWVYDAASGTVAERNVTLGSLRGSDRIEVLSGIGDGEKVVVAGVHMLYEGQQVTILEN